MTTAELLATPAKAEIVNDQLIEMSPTGFVPGFAAGQIFVSLTQYSFQQRIGYAVSDNVGFHTGRPTGMKFLEGAPVFAVEVRSEGDYGSAAEEAMAAKRADYFAAGTLVVWDVDMLSQDVVRVYRADAPDRPVRYRRGQRAEAEPAVPGWSMPVEDLFPFELDAPAPGAGR